MKIKFLFLLAIFAASIFPATAQTTVGDEVFESLAAKPYQVVGKVVGVHDGDTCTVLDAEKTQHKIRFNGIDAPELKQDFGQKSRQNLADMIFGKQVVVKIDKKDKYNREVGVVFLDGKDINLEQAKSGFAWHYKKYASEQSEADQKLYADAEIAARAAKIGLWSDSKTPTPPWSYRDGGDVPAEFAGKIFGNKNTKVFHWAGCPGFVKMSESARRVFDSAAAAEAEGYRAAKNCKTEPPTAASGVKAAAPESGAPVKTVAAPLRPPVVVTSGSETETSTGGGRTYVRGSRGGCYYLNDSGKKTYVDRALCN